MQYTLKPHTCITGMAQLAMYVKTNIQMIKLYNQMHVRESVICKLYNYYNPVGSKKYINIRK